MAGLVIEVCLGNESGPPTELGSFAWWDGLLILFLFIYWGGNLSRRSGWFQYDVSSKCGVLTLVGPVSDRN